MNWKAFDTRARGIKCDKPGCGWEDNSVQEEEYPSYLNKLCPQCGSRLLTEKDLETLYRMHKWFFVLNILFFPFVLWRSFWNFITQTKDTPFAVLRVHKPVGEDRYTVTHQGFADPEDRS